MARSGDFIIEDDNTNNTRTMTPLYSSIYGHGSDALDTDFENTFKEAGKECDGSVGGKITNYSGRYDIGSDAVTTVYRRTGAETEKKSVSFRGLEAAIIEHFFMQTRFVKVLADVTLDIKQPKDGGVIITYSPNLADTVEELLDVLEQKMNALDREELHYDNSGEQKVDEFVKQALDPTLLIYLDKTQRIVHFIGDKDRATEYQHKLKAHLGIIKETSDRRFRRHTRQGPEGTSVQKYPVDATGESYTSSGQENDDFHFERTLQNGLVLKVYKASITKLDVDTIVNAANGTLMHGEGVARVIAMAAGYELDRDSREYIQKNGHLEVGKTCITSPGKLPYRSVIHAVGPQWRDYRDKEECCDVLYGTIMNILRQCGEQGYFSVGMPAISDGIFGVPKELCADMYIKAVVDYCETKEVYPKELHIVDIDVRILKHVEVAFREWERDPSYIVQQIAVPIYLISHPEVDGGEWNSRGSRMDKKIFSGLEARIIDKFFMQGSLMGAVADVATLTREPTHGVPLRSLTMKYDQKKANTVNFILDQLQYKMNALTKEELQFDKGSKDKVAVFVEQERDTKMLVYTDVPCRTVHIVGLDYEQVQYCLHKLKIHLGIIKTTKRGIHRQLFDPADVTGTERSDFSKSNHGQTGKSNKYPDLTDAKNACYSESKSTSTGKYPGGATGGSYAGSGQGNDDFHFERILSNRFVLKVYKASITNLKVDTIVNTANDTLMHEGGVARVIAEAAGYDLEIGSIDYIQKHGYLKVAKNCITSSGKLPYSSVIHAVGPQWHDYRDKVECCDVLYDTIINILRTCESNGYYSVGMSAISAGICGVPKELCADMYVKAAVDFSQLYRENPKELHIIDIDVQILKHVEVAFREWERNPSSIDQKEAVPKYLRTHPEARGGGWNSGGQGVGRGDRGQRQINHDGNSSVCRSQ